MNEKKSTTQWIVNILIGLLLAAYGFIFSNILDQIRQNKESVVECLNKIDNLNPIFLQIQSDLSEIKTDLKWLKKQ